MVKLGDVCEIRIGKTPARKNKDFWGEGLPWLSIKDMNQGRVICETSEEITASAVQTLKITPYPPGTVFFSFKLSIGKVGMSEIEMFTNEAIAAIMPRDSSILSKGYLLEALENAGKRLQGNAAAMGATLNKKSLHEIKIPLPPLEEQQRIAGILEASARQLEKVRQELAVLDSMEASIVSKFTEGINRYVALSEIGTFSGGMTPSKSKKEYWKGDIPWFSSKDLKKDQLSDSIDHLSETAIEETSIKPLKQPGIAISTRGMSLAHSIPSSRIPAGSCVNQDLKVVTPKPSQSLFVLHALIRQKENYLLTKVASSAHGTRKLDFEYLRNLQVPNMPDDRARFLDSALVTMQSQKSMIRNKMHLLEELHRSLETRAFVGRL